MSTIDEIRKKIDRSLTEAYLKGIKDGEVKAIAEMSTRTQRLEDFLEWLNGEVAIIGKDQDGKTHILVARRVQEDPEKLVWADAVQEFNMRNEYTEETKNRAMANETPKEGIISSYGSEVSE